MRKMFSKNQIEELIKEKSSKLFYHNISLANNSVSLTLIIISNKNQYNGINELNPIDIISIQNLFNETDELPLIPLYIWNDENGFNINVYNPSESDTASYTFGEEDTISDECTPL